MAVNKSISKLLQPIAIATRTNIAMNQSELLAVTCDLLKAWENSHVQAVIDLGPASRWLTR